MRILHVIHSLDPRSGGPSNVVRNLVRQQVAGGHRVAVLATTVQSIEPWAPREQYVDGIMSDALLAEAEVYLGRAFGRRPPWSTYAYTPQCRWWLRRRLDCDELRPEVIHIHGLFSHLTSLAAGLARRHDVPYVLRPLGSLDTACYRMGRRRLKDIFSRLFLRKDLRGAACVHVTSALEAEELSRWAPDDKIRIIPNGADVPRLPAEEEAHLLLEKFPQLGGKEVVLFMSRVTAKKRPELLVEAIAELRGEGRDVVLLLAGTDDGRLALVRTTAARLGLEEAVVYAGFLQGELKRAAFALARVMALPSLDENFGIAVIEAMAHAVPVLVTREVGSHVYVTGSGGGLVVDGNAGAIAGGLRTLLDADRGELGLRGRSYVEQNLTWPAIARQVEEVYREILR